ncbi:MAG TPA: glucose-6-phosphate dehydrogenase assembly protein OpcA [Chlamydiales bacterium]|nr:glucose-6-phosphate dehydrogenase assembly protein OpcA [Chlamydiales bacterium]
MTTRLLVSPENIENELLKIWEDLSKENKTRASLFNLVVFNKLSKRTDYFRNIVEKVVEKFPCRTLFITEDPEPKNNYLKTAVSVLIPNVTIACDLIDIGVAGKEIEKVPFLILPHLIPDLPVYVLWTEDPSNEHFLFHPLSKLATRMIFDSESSDNLLEFAKTLLSLKDKSNFDIADLNWARTQGWRNLIASVFDTPKKFHDLADISKLKIVYNARESEFFCHLKIQAMYLLAWLSSRLDWKLVSSTKNLQFKFEKTECSIESTFWEGLGSGTVISVDMTTSKGDHFGACRIKERYHYVSIYNSSPNSCELPYEFVLGQTKTGQSLVSEICMKGTSSHYIDMLRELVIIDKDQVC